MPQKLTFYRSTSGIPNNVVFVDNTLQQHTVILNLTHITWRVPQIKFNLNLETKIRKDILNNTNYELKYRQWFYQNISPPMGNEFTWDFPVAYSKCKYVLLGFQTNKDNQMGVDNSQFDFCD